MKKNNPLRVGIIGGGAAGLTTAWLLDEQYEVTVFEKEERLGGHVYSVPVTKDGKTIFVEAGAEFFSDPLAAEFNALLAALHIPVIKSPISYCFENIKTGKSILLPPIFEGHVSWHSLHPQNIVELVQLKHFIDSGQTILDTHDTGITLEEYANTLTLTDDFKNNFLYPLLTSGWGVTPQEIKSFAAYDILMWMIPNQIGGFKPAVWNEVPDGMHRYITAMAAQLKNTHIQTSSKICAIEHRDNFYQITQSNGTKNRFDRIIIATDPMQACALLKDISAADNVRNVLSQIEYFGTTIAIHGDKRLMPKNEADWAIANILYDGANSALTICKPWMKELTVFRSWITYNLGLPQNELPQPLYALNHFYHLKQNLAYFRAQKELEPLQGCNNLWIAGFYTNGIDSHNSAIISAIRIAQKLAPESARLKLIVTHPE